MREALKTSLRSIFSVPSLFFNWWKGTKSSSDMLRKHNPSPSSPIPMGFRGAHEFKT